MFKRKVHKRPGLTTICVAQGLLEAEVYKSKLESAGIPVLLEYESIGPTLGITINGLGQVQVMVHDELADEARALLEEESVSDEDAQESAPDECF